MVDLGGSLAVASRGLFSTGVSTDLNVTYLSSGGKVGNVINAEVVCDKFGKTMAFTSVVFRDAEGRTFARGSHTKYIKMAWQGEDNAVEEVEEEERAMNEV
jgi:acyl-coenzyme A thioesterase 13